MPRLVLRAEAVAAALELAARHPQRVVWIGIDGFGAAGKSSLAADLVATLPRAQVVRTDDFSGPGIREWDWHRFHAEIVEPARAAGVPAIFVVEGVSSTRAEVELDWDLTIWVDAARETRMQRALARDGEAMQRRWLEDWMPSEEAYAAREHPQDRVDLIVCGEETEDGWVPRGSH